MLERENVENEAYSDRLRSEKEKRAVERLLAMPAGATETPPKGVSVAHLQRGLWDCMEAAGGSNHAANVEPVRGLLRPAFSSTIADAVDDAAD